MENRAAFLGFMGKLEIPGFSGDFSRNLLKRMGLVIDGPCIIR
jgi:hypothetical protein